MKKKKLLQKQRAKKCKENCGEQQVGKNRKTESKIINVKNTRESNGDYKSLICMWKTATTKIESPQSR